jgi:radical SAM protein with 4Fe4S-binding SPASM domain
MTTEDFGRTVAVPDVAPDIRLHVKSPARSGVSPLDVLDFEVTIHNGSPFELAWPEEFPVRLSYHWLSTTGEVLVRDGIRTALTAPIAAGGSQALKLSVQVPRITARAILRFTLVQEGRFWFADLAPASAADMELLVERRPAWVEDATAPSVFAPHADLNSESFGRFIRSKGRQRPLMLICETTNICNNHCIICAYDSQTREKQRMPMEVFRETLRQYADLGGGALSLTPMVGDVFLDKSLPERLAIIAAHRPTINRLSVTTNAGYVKQYDDIELAQLLAAFDDIQISVYGIDADEFSVMTKTSGYELMRLGIERIFRFSRARITIGFRCLRDRQQAELVTWVRSIPGYAEASGRVKISGNLREYANWGVFDTTKALPFDASWRPAVDSEKVQCGIPLLAMQVFSNGNVSFCSCDDFDNTDSLHLGNVMETSLAEMFNSPKARRLWDWQTHGTPEFCRKCSFHLPLSQIIETPGVFENPLVFVGG